VFGGYGGGGQVYGDLWVLHCGGGAFRWEDITEQLHGEGPSPRFDHAAFVFPVTPNSETFDKLAVLGGRDVGQVLGDTHVLDLATLAWEPQLAPDASAGAVVPSPVGEVCCAAVEDVESVPYHKVLTLWAPSAGFVIKGEHVSSPAHASLFELRRRRLNHPCWTRCLWLPFATLSHRVPTR
jgi:dynein heavy chain